MGTWERCGFCGGDGQVDDWGDSKSRKTCVRCSGSGREFVSCSTCGDSGRIIDRDDERNGRPCPYCRGERG